MLDVEDTHFAQAEPAEDEDGHESAIEAWDPRDLLVFLYLAEVSTEGDEEDQQHNEDDNVLNESAQGVSVPAATRLVEREVFYLNDYYENPNYDHLDAPDYQRP